jgi:methyl-accepting chemotaxis protein
VASVQTSAGPPEGPIPAAVKRPVKRLRAGLGFKFVGAAGLSIALVATILALSFAREVRGLLEEELTSRGRMAALALANTTASMVFAHDVSGLEELARATLADVPGAAYVLIRDESGRSLAEAAQAALGDARPDAVDLTGMDLGSRLLERTLTVSGREMLHVVALVTFKGKAEVQYLDPLGLRTAAGAGSAGLKVLGSVEIGFPLADLTRQVAAASRRSMALAALVFAACLLAMIPLARFMTRPLVGLSRAALGIAGGDLRQSVSRSGDDEVADLARSFARMVSELQSMLGELKETAAALAQESDTMLAAATRQAGMATQQAASVAQMSTSIREIAQTAGAAIDRADGVIAVTQTAEESSIAGGRVVEEAVGSTAQVEQHVGAIASRLVDLSGRVGQIRHVIVTVESLASQSNLLALNAAIEASRAGAAGTSFSVIAREMRALAEQSASAASGVPKLLGDVVETARAAVKETEQGRERARSTAALAQRAGETIGGLAGICRESAAAARQIAESSRQQATGVNEIVTALSQLGQAAEGTVDGGEEMRRAAERLKAVSARLTSLAERYRS